MLQEIMSAPASTVDPSGLTGVAGWITQTAAVSRWANIAVAAAAVVLVAWWVRGRLTRRATT